MPVSDVRPAGSCSELFNKLSLEGAAQSLSEACQRPAQTSTKVSSQTGTEKTPARSPLKRDESESKVNQDS